MGALIDSAMRDGAMGVGTGLIYLPSSFFTTDELIACIDGRGFRVRREDMRKILLATRGKVFTLASLDRLIEHTRLREFLPRPS